MGINPDQQVPDRYKGRSTGHRNSARPYHFTRPASIGSASVNVVLPGTCSVLARFSDRQLRRTGAEQPKSKDLSLSQQ